MRTAVAVSLGRLALEHQPEGFQRLKRLVQLLPLGSHFGDLFLNVADCAFQIVHQRPRCVSKKLDGVELEHQLDSRIELSSLRRHYGPGLGIYQVYLKTIRTHREQKDSLLQYKRAVPDLALAHFLLSQP